MDLHACAEVLIHLLDTYDERRSTSSAAHAKQVLYDVKLGSDEEDFVLQSFVGLVRRLPVLDAVLPLFCQTLSEKEKRNPPSWNSLKIVLYLSLFELTRRLSWDQFAELVAALPSANQVAKFIGFFSNPETLENQIQRVWREILDESFVTKNLLEPVQSHLPRLRKLSQDLTQANLKPPPEPIPKKPPTVPQPFQLSEAPVKIPVTEPSEILTPPTARVRPIPKSTYEKPCIDDALRGIREIHKKGAEELLCKVKSFNPNYQRPMKTEKTSRKLAEMLEDEERELKFHKAKAHEVPSNLRTPIAPVKQTTAVILREGANIKKKLQDEIKRVDELSRGAVDDNEYKNWQREVRKQQVEERARQMEERRWNVKLAKEEAKMARLKAAESNKEKAKQLKEENKEKMMECLQEKLKKDEQMKMMVEDVVQGQGRVKESMKKLSTYKRNLAKEVQSELRVMTKKAMDEAEQELHKKAAIAQEIRALQSVPALMEKTVLDLTTTCGEGFLEEMSLAELQERLVLLKSWEKEAEEMKRHEILASKKRKAQFVMQTAEAVKKQREQEELAKLLKKQEAAELQQLEMQAKEKVRTQNEHVQELRKKVQEKKTQNRALRFASATSKKANQRKQLAQKMEQLAAAKQDLMKLVA